MKKDREEQKSSINISFEHSIIARIGQIISSTLNIEEVYEQFAQEAKKLIDFDGISIVLINEEEDTQTITYTAGLIVRKKGEVLPISNSGIEGILKTAKGLILEKGKGWDGYSVVKKSFPMGVNTVLISPFVYQGKTIGFLHIRAMKEKAFGERDLRFAGLIGSQIAGAIAHAQLFKELTKSRDELEQNAIKLSELNTALKVLLQQMEKEKKELEQRIVSNIEQLVLPYIEKLKNCHLEPLEKNLVHVIDSNLKDIAFPHIRFAQNHNLTPAELKVATLTRSGKTTKEIAMILGVAPSTVESHRKGIRKKLSLPRKTNLTTYLLSI
ncbi:MAG: LuxR C-terminal-related transcriptional regulator [Syntrophorhabdaceae bacterium]|nr:LuxR C-terminal-related transcriptional regulator [Syntrophorhabdaceae bacterium]